MAAYLDQFVDFLTKNSLLGTAFVTVVGGYWILKSYQHSKKLEYLKSFNDKQLEIVALTAQTAGELAAAEGESGWKSARARFWELYWGRLVLFEDKGIINAMINLGKKLNDPSFEARQDIKSECYSLSLALREFLIKKNAEDWKIKLLSISEAVRMQKLKPD